MPVAQKYAIPETTADFSDVCRRPDIDVIDVCTPPNLHSAQIREALQAGKHVICQNPQALRNGIELPVTLGDARQPVWYAQPTPFAGVKLAMRSKLAARRLSAIFRGEQP